MLGNDAYLGSLSLRSVVTTHEFLLLWSLDHHQLSCYIKCIIVFFSTLDAKVA